MLWKCSRIPNGLWSKLLDPHMRICIMFCFVERQFWKNLHATTPHKKSDWKFEFRDMLLGIPTFHVLSRLFGLLPGELGFPENPMDYWAPRSMPQLTTAWWWQPRPWKLNLPASDAVWLYRLHVVYGRHLQTITDSKFQIGQVEKCWFKRNPFTIETVVSFHKGLGLTQHIF